MYAIIKGFEGDFAVCEINGEDRVSIERTYLPREARVGTAIVLGDKVKRAIEETLRLKPDLD